MWGDYAARVVSSGCDWRSPYLEPLLEGRAQGAVDDPAPLLAAFREPLAMTALTVASTKARFFIHKAVL